MTGGSEATAISRLFRGACNYMILRPESGGRRIRNAARHYGEMRFAQYEDFLQSIHSEARELTPGPRGPGED
jgi:hypothetical protein